MSRNDPTHNLKWNAKENPGFSQPNQLDLGPKNFEIKAQSFYENMKIANITIVK